MATQPKRRKSQTEREKAKRQEHQTDAEGSRSRRTIIYVSASLIAGITLLAVASCLALTSTVIKPPSAEDAAFDQPWIQVSADRPLAKFTIFADFRTPNSYTLAFFPEAIDDIKRQDAPQPGEGVRIFLSVRTRKTFSWKDLSGGLVNEDPQGPDDDVMWRPTDKTHEDPVGGAFFSGVLGGSEPLRLSITPNSPPQVRSGPFIRLAMPVIESVHRGPDTGPRNQALGKLDGKPLYEPNFSVLAEGDALDTKNSDLSVYKLVPTPDSDPPLQWKVDGKFISDVVFRDGAWDRKAAVKVFLAGIFIGIGSTILLLPLSLLAPSKK